MESGETKPSDAENLDFDRHIQIWSKAVDTQMHFNEMCVKSRQFGLTFVAAALGLGIVLLSQGKDFAMNIPIHESINLSIHVAFFLVIGAAFAMRAVSQLDLRVYHRMLRGAVMFGEDFEENHMKKMFSLNKGMTQAISHYSRHDNASVIKGSRPYEYTGSDSTSAEDKIRHFYNRTIWTLVAVAIGIFWITNPSWMGFAVSCILAGVAWSLEKFWPLK